MVELLREINRSGEREREKFWERKEKGKREKAEWEGDWDRKKKLFL